MRRIHQRRKRRNSRFARDRQLPQRGDEFGKRVLERLVRQARRNGRTGTRDLAMETR